MIESLLIALASGVVTGLITWGGLRVELQWIRADVDRAHARLDHLDRLHLRP